MACLRSRSDTMPTSTSSSTTGRWRMPRWRMSRTAAGSDVFGVIVTTAVRMMSSTSIAVLLSERVGSKGVTQQRCDSLDALEPGLRLHHLDGAAGGHDPLHECLTQLGRLGRPAAHPAAAARTRLDRAARLAATPRLMECPEQIEPVDGAARRGFESRLEPGRRPAAFGRLCNCRLDLRRFRLAIAAPEELDGALGEHAYGLVPRPPNRAGDHRADAFREMAPEDGDAPGRPGQNDPLHPVPVDRPRAAGGR